MGFFFFCVCVCVSHAFASVHCCHVFTCLERAGLLNLVGDVYYILATFPCGILGQVWYLIVSFPDLCRLSYFKRSLYVYKENVFVAFSIKSFVLSA